MDISGDIIVVDYDNDWVSIFFFEVKFKIKIGVGYFMGFKGVIVDLNGFIIVVDSKLLCFYFLV